MRLSFGGEFGLRRGGKIGWGDEKKRGGKHCSGGCWVRPEGHYRENRV